MNRGCAAGRARGENLAVVVAPGHLDGVASRRQRVALGVGYLRDERVARSERQMHAMMIAAIHKLPYLGAHDVDLRVRLRALGTGDVRTLGTQREHRLISNAQALFASTAFPTATCSSTSRLRLEKSAL